MDTIGCNCFRKDISFLLGSIQISAHDKHVVKQIFKNPEQYTESRKTKNEESSIFHPIV
jgi:hypothetical protein